MIIGFGNNVVSSLAADITASQTTIQVMPGAGAMLLICLPAIMRTAQTLLKLTPKLH